MPDHVTVREADEDDVPTLVRFVVKLDAHVSGADAEALQLTPKGRRQIARRLRGYVTDPAKLLLVGEVPGAGLVAMGDVALWYYEDIWRNPERQGMATAYIDDLWVEEEYRSSGVGKAIVGRLVDFAAANDIHELTLEYSASNEVASAAWERLGFRTTGVRAAATVAEVRRRLKGGRGRKAKTGSRGR